MDLPKPEQPPLKDRGIRLALIPAFGLGIPRLTDLFGRLGPGDAAWWVGTGWFVLLSFLIWQGNRFFLLRQRASWDWLSAPLRKVMALLAANVFYTAPLTVGMLVLWYRVGPLRVIDWAAIETTTLLNVIAVVFITHVYETVYLIGQREDDLARFERLERQRARAELEALKGQVNPHFMFNALNTLAFLIERSPARALRFTEDLADLYRYILASHDRPLVPLAEEMDFARKFAGVLRLRFGETALLVDWPPESADADRLVPSISVQVLLENAVKHNAFDEQQPMRVVVSLDETGVTVSNPVRARRTTLSPSSGVGLANLSDRCRLLTGMPLRVERDAGRFAATVPWVPREVA